MAIKVSYRGKRVKKHLAILWWLQRNIDYEYQRFARYAAYFRLWSRTDIREKRLLHDRFRYPVLRWICPDLFLKYFISSSFLTRFVSGLRRKASTVLSKSYRGSISHCWNWFNFKRAPSWSESGFYCGKLYSEFSPYSSLAISIVLYNYYNIGTNRKYTVSLHRTKWAICRYCN